MQFINIVVHSVENMNFRVHLQFEFTNHGLDKYLGVSVRQYRSGRRGRRVKHLAAERSDEGGVERNSNGIVAL